MSAEPARAFGAPALGCVVKPPIDYWRGASGQGKPKSQAKKVGKQAAGHEYAGYSSLSLIVNFVCWAFEQQHFPSPQSIQERFRCSRATAYRLRRALADAYGIEPPKFDHMTGQYEHGIRIEDPTA